MKRKLYHALLTFGFLICTYSVAICQTETDIPTGVSDPVKIIIQKTFEQMDASRYDKALATLSQGFYRDSNQISLVDQYYLHAFEAEIMYYTALFDIGLSSAIQSESIALELNNDTLIGSSKNLVGLMLMNIGDYKSAVNKFKQAIELLPFNHKLAYLSFRYHAQTNLGECYLKLGMTDSCIYHTTQGLAEVKLKKRNRGIALAYWNIGEAFLLKKQNEKAVENFKMGLSLVENTHHKDVSQTIMSSLMKIALLENDKEQAMKWLNEGLSLNQDTLNTEFSRITFLENSIDVCFHFGEVSLANDLFHQLFEMKNQQAQKQLEQRSFLLKEYFSKKQNLERLKETTKNQEAEISLRKKTQGLLVGLLLAILITFIILFQIRRQRQRIRELEIIQSLQEKQKKQDMNALKDKLEAIYIERNRIASDLHDDIGASLSSIRIYSDAALKQFAYNPEESKKLMARINISSSDMMEKMSDIIWVINPKNDQAENLILRMKLHLSEVLSTSQIKVNYQIHSELESLRITTFARRNMYLTFKEAINNIVKYSDASQVQIELKLLDEKLLFVISDNGVGFDSNSKESGNGLGNMKRRIKALGGILTITTSLGKGCTLFMEMDLTKISE